MTRIRIWLSADGYRDPDDNLSLLVGAAQARVTAKASSDVSVAGVVFGDTKDGGQFYMANPSGTAPAAFGSDSRYGSVEGNKQAAGNYAFFKKYAAPALKELAPGWESHDLLASDSGGMRAWNFAATQKSQITGAAQSLAQDIIDAINKTGGAATAAELVVYSAGGGANVAAEAVGYLRNQGYSEALLAQHFAVVQHGNNWVTNYEAAARVLTRNFTVAISNQNLAEYANGADGPNLKQALSGPLADTAFGNAFDKAIAVATGASHFQNLGSGLTFKSTRDASDFGSHAFAASLERLLAALDDRLSGSEEMRTGDAWAHLIDQGGSTRLREIFSDFDPAAVAELLATGRLGTGARPAPEPGPGDPGTPLPGGPDTPLPGGPDTPETGTAKVAVAVSRDDAETVGGLASDDLDLGTTNRSGAMVDNAVGLRFTGLELAEGAEIESAYFLFQAKAGSAAAGVLTIAVENDRAAQGFAAGFDGRSYLGETVSWTPGAWKAGESYRSPDIADLIEAVIGDGGLDALDALAFRVTGTGNHKAFSYDSNGAAPVLVIDYA